MPYLNVRAGRSFSIYIYRIDLVPRLQQITYVYKLGCGTTFTLFPLWGTKCVLWINRQDRFQILINLLSNKYNNTKSLPPENTAYLTEDWSNILQAKANTNYNLRRI